MEQIKKLQLIQRRIQRTDTCIHRFCIHGYRGRSVYPDIYTVFHSGCTKRHSRQQKLRVAPQSCQHLVLSAFLFLTFLVSVLWYVIMVLTYISLMTNEVKYLSMYLLAVAYLLLWSVCSIDTLHTHACTHSWFFFSGEPWLVQLFFSNEYVSFVLTGNFLGWAGMANPVSCAASPSFVHVICL